MRLQVSHDAERPSGGAHVGFAEQLLRQTQAEEHWNSPPGTGPLTCSCPADKRKPQTLDRKTLTCTQEATWRSRAFHEWSYKQVTMVVVTAKILITPFITSTGPPSTGISFLVNPDPKDCTFLCPSLRRLHDP